ncbi:MAG TPA: methylated-DNA--[protein]-cysteine S-methyltransferase [Planctomycetota bacterium]|nr:methylated-DNA--[protein]-cysteine S-methyltransferase [Planctomycetota bacterium]
MWTIDLPSPVGTLRAFASENGLRALSWPGEDAARLAAGSAPGVGQAVLQQLAHQLAQYFAGERTVFELPLDPVGTPFQLAAWRALCTIPFGATRTYAQQAAAVGRPRAARAVGAANARNALAIVVPCHRVVGAGGSLTGFAGGLDAKRTLLEHEARVLGARAARPPAAGVRA